MIKTLHRHEADTLHAQLDAYQSYLCEHPDSLLTRYVGSHSLKMFGSEFHFIVMQSVFRAARPINARYDLKGSWVNRSAPRPTPGSRARCRHCKLPYVVGRDEQCRGRTEHEPDVVLKDNDFTTKISLRPEQSVRLIQRLEDDSAFLDRQGIMDYSLLVGVHHIPFTVNPRAALKRHRRESLRMSNSANLRNSTGSSAPPRTAPSHAPSRALGGAASPPSQSAASPHAGTPGLALGVAAAKAHPSHPGVRPGAHPGTLLPPAQHVFARPVETDAYSLARTSQGGLDGLDEGSEISDDLDHGSDDVSSSHGAYSALDDGNEDNPLGLGRGALGLVAPDEVTDFGGFTGFMQVTETGDPSAADRGAAGLGSLASVTGTPEEEEEELLADPTSPILQARVVVGPGLYYVGVVDTLQTWSMRKRLERLLKVWCWGPGRRDPNGLSCMEPHAYAKRFRRRVREVVEHDFVRQIAPPLTHRALGAHQDAAARTNTATNTLTGL